MSTGIGTADSEWLNPVDLQQLREARQARLDARVNEAQLGPQESLTPRQVRAQQVVLNDALDGVETLSGNSVGSVRLSPNWSLLFPARADLDIYRATRPDVLDDRQTHNIKRGYAALNNEANRERTLAVRTAARLGSGEHRLPNGDRVTVGGDPRTGTTTVETTCEDGAVKTVTVSHDEPEQVSIVRTDQHGQQESLAKDGTKVCRTTTGAPFERLDATKGTVAITCDVDLQGNATRTVEGPGEDDYQQTTVNGDGSTLLPGQAPEPLEPWRPLGAARYPWDLDPFRPTYSEQAEPVGSSGMAQGSNHTGELDSAPAPAELLASLKKEHPQAYQAFERLSPQQQAQFLRLAQALPALGPFGSMFAAPGQGPSIDSNLLKLLKSGRLTRTDSRGHTLLDDLGQLLTQPMAPGLNGKWILRELVGNLADPGLIVQGDKGTCTVTTLEYMQASRDPAEYARIVAGLTSKDGTVKMGNGDVLRREQGTAKNDNSGRSDVDRMYQAAVMEYANGGDTYNDQTDRSKRPDGATYEGLTSAEVQRALDALMPKHYRSTPYQDSPTHRPEVEALFRSMLARKIFIPVGLKWGTDKHGKPGFHELAVVGMDRHYVYLRNPWGAGDDGSTSDGPNRQLVDHQGLIRMSKAEFFSLLVNYQRP